MEQSSLQQLLQQELTGQVWPVCHQSCRVCQHKNKCKQLKHPLMCIQLCLCLLPAHNLVKDWLFGGGGCSPCCSYCEVLVGSASTQFERRLLDAESEGKAVCSLQIVLRTCGADPAPPRRLPPSIPGARDLPFRLDRCCQGSTSSGILPFYITFRDGGLHSVAG